MGDTDILSVEPLRLRYLVKPEAEHGYVCLTRKLYRFVQQTGLILAVAVEAALVADKVELILYVEKGGKLCGIDYRRARALIAGLPCKVADDCDL